jgi:hypothetical protein
MSNPLESFEQEAAKIKASLKERLSGDPLPGLRDERDELITKLRAELRDADTALARNAHVGHYWGRLPTWAKILLPLVVLLGLLWAGFQLADWWSARSIERERKIYEATATKLQTELDAQKQAITAATLAQQAAAAKVLQLEEERDRLLAQNTAFQATLAALATRTTAARITYEQTQTSPRNDFNFDADYSSELQRLRARQERLGVAAR